MQVMEPDQVQQKSASQLSSSVRRAWPRWALVALLVLAVSGFYALGLHRYFAWDSFRSHLDIWQAGVRQHLLLAVLVFFLAYLAATALSLPVAAVLTLAAGALFGRWLGTAVISIASTLGATLAFLSSRYLFQQWVQRRFQGRLERLYEGVETDGAYYLFTLRLVPVVPFFLINIGMGLTRMRAWTFASVSLLGMLPGTFLYVNARTELARIDSPTDVLSLPVLIALALLGLVPLGLRKLIQWKNKPRPRTVGIAVVVLLSGAVVALAARQQLRYRVAEVMEIPVREFTNVEYPEDPAGRSVHFGQYSGRALTLVQKDDSHFDFIFKPTNPNTATLSFRNVDVSLMTPSLPEWTKADPGLERIALTDRQWNRQQVSFDPHSPQVEVDGGDGFEKANLYSAELAKNCLNAGLWEILLFVKEDGNKALYYQGWFTFPLGHYQRIFERNTGLSYWSHWYYLEHWFDPVGTGVRLDGLRRVVKQRVVPTTFDTSEEVIVAGEQVRKRRTTMPSSPVTWGDFFDGRRIRFATFIPPGRYSVEYPRKNEYWRMNRFDKAILREVVSPAASKPLHELELVFQSRQTGEPCRFLVSGFDPAELPQLAVKEYPKGLYLPMGIGVPPFFQSYEELQKNPPHRSPYFCVMLDAEDRWIDHHALAVDGPVLHRDATNPDLLHVYLLSYERHSLIAHFIVSAR